MIRKAWQRLRLVGVVAAAGATVILQMSAERLIGIEDQRLHAGIGEHR